MCIFLVFCISFAKVVDDHFMLRSYRNTVIIASRIECNDMDWCNLTFISLSEETAIFVSEVFELWVEGSKVSLNLGQEIQRDWKEARRV